MEFSDPLPCERGVRCAVSPDGRYVATPTSDFRLVIRQLETLNLLQSYTCLDVVSHVEWSSDSKYVLCAMIPRGIVSCPRDTVLARADINHHETTVVVVCLTDASVASWFARGCGRYKYGPWRMTNGDANSTKVSRGFLTLDGLLMGVIS